MRVLAGCLYFNGIPAVSSSKFSIALLIFATDLGNGNAMSEKRLIAELNTKALVRALTVMKTFHDQINLHQATMTPILVMPGVITLHGISME